MALHFHKRFHPFFLVLLKIKQSWEIKKYILADVVKLSVRPLQAYSLSREKGGMVKIPRSGTTGRPGRPQES